ncbi:hypothetical protein RHMOL_Rhmol12G0053800 [Rhododendron molle]|uniref:Uncharacterized protein n=1 Tax=Rhododendron molle TaxID=49168 RepID=A0ACC0LFS4_RHOML|nr:hypothetical protein RHMOL_Rhmol12G0053800 [Rhododendron molle]
MCSITALAHLRAAVLFFLDISGSSGYTIARQAALFHSIKSLFMNKPLIIVCNKIDLQPLDGLSEEDMKLVIEMKSEAIKTMIGQGGDDTDDVGVLFTMSTLTEDGVIAVKNAACERLLNQLVELKMKSTEINNFLNRFHVAMPKPLDQKERPSCIPQAVLETKAKKEMEKENKKLERDLEDETGGAGAYSADLRKHYILANDEWKGDVMPEILDGRNVSDFFDPDILQRLEELECEEGLVPEQEVGDDCDMDGHELTAEKQEDLAKIRKRLIQQNRIKKSTAESRPIVPRKFDKDKEFTSERMGRQSSDLGLDPTLAINWACSRSRGRKRERSLDHMDLDVDHPNKKLRVRST